MICALCILVSASSGAIQHTISIRLSFKIMIILFFFANNTILNNHRYMQIKHHGEQTPSIFADRISLILITGQLVTNKK